MAFFKMPLEAATAGTSVGAARSSSRWSSQGRPSRRGHPANAGGAAAATSQVTPLRRKQRVRKLIAALCAVGGIYQYVSNWGIFESTVPNSGTLHRALASLLFRERRLSRNKGNGDCDWQPPAKLDGTFDPPRTLLVSYPGSGKRLTWRMIEGLTGYVAGDDWDLSEEGTNVALMKTSYPHGEGIWSWGDLFKTADIVLLIRSPRWAIPSYQTMRYELGYSNSREDSLLRRPNTYTERPSIQEWENWRDVNANAEIERWGWFIDFWMQDGLRGTDEGGNPVQDDNCIAATGNMDDCTPKVIVSFEKLFDPSTSDTEFEKLADALEDGRPDMPIIEREARACVFEKTRGKRGSEANWDNTARDAKGPDNSQKTFTLPQLEKIKLEIERLVASYSANADPLAVELVSILGVYLAEVEDEIGTYPTPSPTPAPLPLRVQAGNFVEESSSTELVVFDGTKLGNFNLGDYVSYGPLDFGSLGTYNTIRVRYASSTTGGRVQARLDSTTGQLISEITTVNTGGLGVYKEYDYDIIDPTEGSHVLTLVVAGMNQIWNLEWVELAHVVHTPSPTASPTATAAPVSPTTPSPTPPCSACTDKKTPWMGTNGKDCATASDLISTKCNKADSWTTNNFCQFSCYVAGNGYAGDVCCLRQPGEGCFYGEQCWSGTCNEVTGVCV